MVPSPEAVKAFPDQTTGAVTWDTAGETQNFRMARTLDQEGQIHPIKNKYFELKGCCGIEIPYKQAGLLWKRGLGAS